MAVRTERHAGVALVTLDWPETRNALDTARIDELAAAISEAGRTAAAVVLTGNGAFCAGANLRVVADRIELSEDEQRASIEQHAQALVRAVIGAPVPVVAAVDGAAIGLGFDLALACDCRLVGPEGWLMQGWGRMGLIPGTGGELLLRLRNPTVLWHLLEYQPRVDGALAERWGLGEWVEDSTALDAALRRAEALSALPAATVAAYVELSRSALRRELPDHLDRCASIQASLLTSPDVRARAAAILDRPR